MEISSSKPKSKSNIGGRLHNLHARYELVQNPIGEGAFADVYRARHRLAGRDVAVKIFHADAAGTTTTGEEEVEREVQIMRLLRNHPHVIRFYEAVAHGGCGQEEKEQQQSVCIVMELAESGELYNHVLSSHGLEEGEARRVFLQVVAGVAYCHRNMVVHHDLKLENVLLDAGKNVKLADFGFSNFFGPDLLPGAGCGSPLYAAPEMLELGGRRYLGPEVDVWSCGVILFAMLSGHLPFDGPDEFTIKRRISSGVIKIPPTLSDEPRDLISSMLQVNPKKRMSIDEVHDHPWLLPSIPRYLAMPLPPLHANTQILKVADEIVEEVVRIFGFDKNSLVESLHKRVENEATVAYYLMLDKRFDAPTRYLWTVYDETPVPLAIALDTQSGSVLSAEGRKNKSRWVLGLEFRE